MSNGVKVLKIIAIIAVILMVVSVVYWFVLFKERKELEEGYQAGSQEEVDLEEVRRIFEEEGYIEEGQYSPSPDEEYPALPLGEQKEGVALKK